MKLEGKPGTFSDFIAKRRNLHLLSWESCLGCKRETGSGGITVFCEIATSIFTEEYISCEGLTNEHSAVVEEGNCNKG